MTTIKSQIKEMLQKKIEEEWGYEGYSLEDVELELNENETVYFMESEIDGWDDQGKYQYQQQIYEAALVKDGDWDDTTYLGIFFAQDIQRSGSYFTHYEYYHEKPVEVELKEYEKTITVREWTEV